jgi:hypothetical protein
MANTKADTMARQWCEHYRGMHEKDQCEAGVKFKDLPLHGTKAFMHACPCFGPQQASTCVKAEYPTAEQMQAREQAFQQKLVNTGLARLAIVEHLGGPWKRGTPGASGTIDCPVCKAESGLRFSRAGYNGHIHAACKTEGCVSWME